jgi:hypothetical protein
MRKFRLSLVLILLLLTSQQVSYAQDTQTAVVFIYANYYQLQVTVDDQPRGKTPLKLTLPVGLHTFKFTADGFPERVEKVLVYEGGYDYKVYIYMEDKAQDASLVSLLVQPDYAMWEADQDKLWFSAPRLYRYDPVSEALTPESNYPDVTPDAELMTRLDSTIQPHASTSGRFVTYVARNAPYTLTILDTQTKQSIQVGIISPITPQENFELLSRIDWSRNEKYGVVPRTLSYDSTVVITEDEKLRLMNVTEFKNADSKRITADSIYSRPSDDGRIIISGVIEGGREVVRLWALDLHTLIGKPLPFANGDYWDAEFSADGKQIMVARWRSIVRYDVSTGHSETVSTVLGFFIPSRVEYLAACRV